jgi:hypothetical protein
MSEDLEMRVTELEGEVDDLRLSSNTRVGPYSVPNVATTRPTHLRGLGLPSRTGSVSGSIGIRSPT